MEILSRFINGKLLEIIQLQYFWKVQVICDNLP